MQRDTYVDSLDPLSVLKLFIPFINPIEPIEIKSSWSTLVFEYFLQT